MGLTLELDNFDDIVAHALQDMAEAGQPSIGGETPVGTEFLTATKPKDYIAGLGAVACVQENGSAVDNTNTGPKSDPTDPRIDGWY